MLGVSLLVAFWALLGVAVFVIAIRGGLGGVRTMFQARSRGARKLSGTAWAIIYVAFGVALPLVLLIGNNVNASSRVGGIRLNSAEKRGRELFGQHCGVCHTLAAANAIGKVGPNLDVLRPAESLVLHTIMYGCLQNPPSPSSPQVCLGEGNMPALVLTGQEAQDVAQFVAKVAGRE